MPPTPDIAAVLQQARDAAYGMATLPTEVKNDALERFAARIESEADALLAANARDLAASDNLAPALAQRLKLDRGKLIQLAQGLRDVARLPDPVGQRLSATQLDDRLVLEKVSVPLGVVGVIFESRPDVIPQILALMLKSGNACVLKGGTEALHSNRAFMGLVAALSEECPELPPHWAQLLETREAVHALLGDPTGLDLVIPRGSNELVRAIQQATQIPVLGHADGICHLYVHPSANLAAAIPVILDSKAQYPAACNALETLLVDQAVAAPFFEQFLPQAERKGLQLKGCEQTRAFAPGLAPATEVDWRTEYGDLTLSIRVVDGLASAIAHINAYGSHHTDGILAEDPTVQTAFLQRVDSASVYVNASTRFADGFRYGLGAEVGISTAKTHARGPVGLEGLVIYQYRLRGQGHVVSDYVGEQARAFQHQRLSE